MNPLVLATFTTAILLIVCGLFLMIKSSNILRILLTLEILMKSATLLLVIAGYINGKLMLVQTYIVTVIVVEVVLVIAAAGVVISLYRKSGSVDTHDFNKLKG